MREHSTAFSKSKTSSSLLTFMARFSLSTTTAILAIAAVLILAATREVEGATITCPEVYGYLNQCISYLRAGGTPSRECCSAGRSLLAAQRTMQDRRTACMCLKTAGAGVTGLKPANANALPAKCGIAYRLQINRNTDCSRVN